AELPQALLALQRVAGVGVRRAEAVEHGRVLLVEDVEHLGEELDAEVAAEHEVLRYADVELLERIAALAVDVRRAGLDIAGEAVAVDVAEAAGRGAGQQVVGLGRAVAEEGGGLDAPGGVVDGAEGQLVARIGVEG